MEQQTNGISIQRTRQRQFFLVLPVLVLPFLTFLLWTMGLIGSETAKGKSVHKAQGLMTSLPDTVLTTDKGWTKLNYYEQADKDSAKYQQEIKNDPYYNSRLSDTGNAEDAGTEAEGNAGMDRPAAMGSLPNGTDPNVEKIDRKLAELNKALSSAAQSKVPMPPQVSDTANNPIPAHLSDTRIDNLERFVQSAGAAPGTPDADITQLSTVMDKILAVEHPELLQDSLRRQSERYRKEVFPVTVNKDENNITLLQTNRVTTESDTAAQLNDILVQATPSNGFYSLDDQDEETSGQNAVEAVVNQTQTLTSGSTIQLRLTGDIYINGILIPQDNFVYGTVQLNGERLMVSIHSIRYRENILPVVLSAYDLDGQAGIYIPGAITRDVAKQSGDEAIQSIGLNTFDQSLGAQAASAGIQAAKTLIGKKVKLVRVTVKAGYRVLLKNSKQ